MSELSPNPFQGLVTWVAMAAGSLTALCPVGLADPAALLLQAATSVVALFALGWMCVLVHELGHAVAAVAVGASVCQVSLGAGPVLWRSVRLQVRAFPWDGHVDAERPASEVKRVVFYLAGAVGNLAFAALVFAISTVTCLPGFWGVACCVAHGLVGITSLLPLSPGMDGWQIACILREGFRR